MKNLIIPARGQQRFQGNIKLFKNKPMIAWSIEAKTKIAIALTNFSIYGR